MGLLRSYMFFCTLMLRIFLFYMLLSLESRAQCDMPLQALLGHVLKLIRSWDCLSLTQMLKFKLVVKGIAASGSKFLRERLLL